MAEQQDDRDEFPYGERVCPNWLKSLGELTRNTESPAHFWLWAGIFTICASLNRRVWVPYGFDPVYPNLYVMLVAPPGKCRKGSPLTLSKRLLSDIQASVSVDSSSKESLVKDLASRLRTEGAGDDIVPVSPMAIISKELSSLLSVDAKKMIEILIELYDSHDVWEHKVLSREPDKIHGPCLSLFAGTTPTWMASNIPYESFGAGFFSRVIMVVGEDKPHKVPIPHLSEADAKLYRMLRHDLNIIRQLWGPFTWPDEAKAVFVRWYNTLDRKYSEIRDERFHGFIERAHLAVIKTAMAIRLAQDNSLVFIPDDLGQAIDLVEQVFVDLPKAFSMDAIVRQLVAAKQVKFSMLFKANWMNVTEETLWKIIKSLGRMKLITSEYQTTDNDYIITWKGGT